MQLARFAHLLGLAALLGGVLAAVALPAAPETPMAMRPAMDALTWSLAMPGLVVTTISGCLLLFIRAGFMQQRWLLLHLGAAVVLMLVIVLALLPVSRELAATAEATAPPDSVMALVGRERIVLWLSACLILTTAVLGFFKPRFKRRS